MSRPYGSSAKSNDTGMGGPSSIENSKLVSPWNGRISEPDSLTSRALNRMVTAETGLSDVALLRWNGERLEGTLQHAVIPREEVALEHRQIPG